jgi:lysine biosynthesis protein LysW
MKSRIDARLRVRAQTAIVTCPDCGERILLRGVLHLGLLLSCPKCELQLEVVNMAPVEVDWAPQEPGDEQEFLARW